MSSRVFKAVLLFLFVPLFAYPQEGGQYFLFSYFKGNGEDGLHLAVSKDGYQWTALKNDKSFLTPAAGKDKLMRDPCIIKGKDGLYHMVWTVSWNERSIGYASSKDLINWSEQKTVPVMEHEPTALNCWAPEIFYDKVRDEYLIFWATTIPGKFQSTEQTGDNKYNHRMYYVTTRDFMRFSPAKLFYDPGFNVIDATIVRDDLRFVMILKDETKTPIKKNLRLAFADKAEGPYSAASEPFTESWVEGPTVVKIGDRWTLFYDQYTRHKMGGRVSKDLQHWEEITDNLSFPAGARHGTVLTITAAEYNRLVESNQDQH